MLRLAYLTNEYPAPSHTFIRREIVAVEGIVGEAVLRFAVRPAAAPLVAPADREEFARTDYLLGRRPGRLPGAAASLRLAGDVLLTLLRRPLCFAGALRAAIRLSRGANRGVAAHLAYLAQACALGRRARAAGVDHLHVHFASNPAAIALLCERLGGPRWSLTVHGPEEFDDPPGFRLAEKIAAARFVVGVSAFTADALRRVARPEDAGKIQVIPCGLDAAFLDAPPTPVPPEQRLVCVGRLSARKRQALLVRALARAVARGFPDARLTLIGDGPERAAVEREIAASNLAGHVDLAGWQDERGVRAALDGARCFVLPSSAEGLPVAIMEALALGRPVIATDVAGIPELVEEGVSGWLIPVDDEDALAEAIEQGFTMAPAHLTEMGEVGRRRVHERHDARRSAAALVGLIGRE
jgi:glycosyltransferase involved in cell wall biosynthesis